jgi:hypothetical protein
LILDEHGLVAPYKNVEPCIANLQLLTDSSDEEQQLLEMAVLLPAFTPIPSACMYWSLALQYVLQVNLNSQLAPCFHVGSHSGCWLDSDA